MISTTKLISCMRQCTVGVREGVAVWNCVILPITLRPSSQGTFGGEELLYLLSLFFNLVFHQQSVLSVVPLQPLTVLSQLNSGALGCQHMVVGIHTYVLYSKGIACMLLPEY